MSQAPIKVGMIADRTGPLSFVGIANANVARMVVDEINAALEESRQALLRQQFAHGLQQFRIVCKRCGEPPRHLGWKQFRALGAVALDLCAVASGTLGAQLQAHNVDIPAARGPTRGLSLRTLRRPP